VLRLKFNSVLLVIYHAFDIILFLYEVIVNLVKCGSSEMNYCVEIDHL